MRVVRAVLVSVEVEVARRARPLAQLRKVVIFSAAVLASGTTVAAAAARSAAMGSRCPSLNAANSASGTRAASSAPVKPSVAAADKLPVLYAPEQQIRRSAALCETEHGVRRLALIAQTDTEEASRSHAFDSALLDGTAR